ncbi:hypothetical protein IF188_09625 [Microbacterium sp. NEAU-LLC]|uniref:Tail terminator n=1 Tax=Microbacterium helvum TaxID=2773713 RepID=A0ABR8NPP0_9MICO|nr:hypothetical protein [Microbacterium helvum]MBD3941953.1 hypothetical protein [Microbacterium helvum]
MSQLTDRLAELTDAVTKAIRYNAELTDAQLVTISNDGADFIKSTSQRAGGVIVYPFPKVQIPAPRGIRRITWTIGLVAGGRAVDAAARCSDLLDILTTAGIVVWRAGGATVDPTDFATSEDPKAPKIPGWAITITEEQYP